MMQHKEVKAKIHVFQHDDSGRESFMSKVNKIVFIYPLPAAMVRRFLKRKVGRVDEGKNTDPIER